MSKLFDRILQEKEAYRKYLRALPFAEKVKILEKLRDRGELIAKSPLRNKRAKL